MFWKLDRVEAAEGTPESREGAGRFVLHRHHDAAGAHLDLRLEQDGYLAGYRLEGASLCEGAWATEKMPHPLTWLEQDGEAIREDAGTYCWVTRREQERELELHGGAGVLRLRIAREDLLNPACARAVAETMRMEGVAASAAAQTLADGVVARRRAIERVVGLGRELDGGAFDETVWRRTLEGLSLEEIHGHLHGLEVRFDRKYPPLPVSQPEALEGMEELSPESRAMAIARE